MTETTIPYYVVSGASKYCNGSDILLVTKDLDKAKQVVVREEERLNKIEGFAAHPDYWVDIQTIQVPHWTDVNLYKGGFLGHHHDLGDEAMIYSSMTVFELDKEIGTDASASIDKLDQLCKDATIKPSDKTLSSARTFLWCHEDLGIPAILVNYNGDIIFEWVKWNREYKLLITNKED
jgi:hypothetical protein